MESINYKYIIFAIVMLVFYIIRKGLSAKVKESQNNQEQQDLNKKIRDMMEVEEDAEVIPELKHREMALEEPDSEEYEYDEYSEEYNEQEEQYWEQEGKEEKSIDVTSKKIKYEEKKENEGKVVWGFEEAGEDKRKEKEREKADHKIRNKIVAYESQEYDFSNPGIKDLRNAIIWSEILAPPVSERDDKD